MVRYTTKDVVKGLKNPNLILKEARRWPDIIYSNLYTRMNGGGANIMNEDWDNLIILDACRYDYFKHSIKIPGELDHIISNSSKTKQFYQKNFIGKEYHDTVMVSGNGYLPIIDDGILHDIFAVEPESINQFELFDELKPEEFKNPADGYAVLPSTTSEMAIDAYEQYPNKKLVVQFMQPHVPFIGRKGLTLHQRVLNHQEKLNTRSEQHWGNLGARIYDNVDGDLVTINEVREAYEENLELVLEYVSDLVRKLEGKTVITADHGELLGERLTPISKRRFDHIGWIRCDQLCKVPWYVIEGDRREIIPEPPKSRGRMDSDEMEERLRMLGYV